MSDFLRMADETGNDLVSAGFLLESISNLMTVDGTERPISEGDIKERQKFVRLLASTIKNMGYELCEAVELEAAEVREGQEVDHV
ncbi:hypothetical protein ACRS3X_00890 [Ectopseudomonas hydrolytica]|uniref:hypothetical protein n=1 Tax=Ectopseudomonas hydrolytica TaxID=2493633 RepID=UPI003EE26E65